MYYLYTFYVNRKLISNNQFFIIIEMPQEKKTCAKTFNYMSEIEVRLNIFYLIIFILVES